MSAPLELVHMIVFMPCNMIFRAVVSLGGAVRFAMVSRFQSGNPARLFGCFGGLTFYIGVLPLWVLAAFVHVLCECRIVPRVIRLWLGGAGDVTERASRTGTLTLKPLFKISGPS